MQGGGFEWDDAKARANLRKHKISFEDARLAFDDPFGIDTLDDREDYGEERINRTALLGIRLITATFSERNGRFRIISARKATRDEQDEYDGQEG